MNLHLIKIVHMQSLNITCVHFQPIIIVIYCCTESQTINDVFSAIKSVSAKWESIGCELGLYPATIEEIKDKHLEPQQCMFHVLKFWLHHKDDSFKKGIKWRTLIKALKSVNEKDLAETVIQEKGKKTPLATSSSFTFLITRVYKTRCHKANCATNC